MNQFHILCFNVAYLFFSCVDLMCLRKECWWVEMDAWMDGRTARAKGKEADKEYL